MDQAELSQELRPDKISSQIVEEEKRMIEKKNLCNKCLKDFLISFFSFNYFVHYNKFSIFPKNPGSSTIDYKNPKI